MSRNICQVCGHDGTGTCCILQEEVIIATHMTLHIAEAPDSCGLAAEESICTDVTSCNYCLHLLWLGLLADGIHCGTMNSQPVHERDKAPAICSQASAVDCKAYVCMAGLTMRLKIAIWAAPAASNGAIDSWGDEGMPKAVHCSRMLHVSLAFTAHLHGNEKLQAASVSCWK